MTGFVFSTAACVNPRPPYFRLLSWRGVLALSRPVKRSQPLSPCGTFSPSLTLWNDLALSLWNVLGLSPCGTFSPSLTLWNVLALSLLVERSRPLSSYGSSVLPDTWGTFSECMRNVCALVKRLFHNFREN